MSSPEPEVEATDLLIGEIVVREFMAVEDGERYYSVSQTDMPLSTALGLLRLAEHSILAEHDDENDTDDDD